MLEKISLDDYSSAIDLIDLNLPAFETSEVRLKLLQRKLDLQRNYIGVLKKTTLTPKERSKLELLKIAYPATRSEMRKLEEEQQEPEPTNADVIRDENKRKMEAERVAEENRKLVNIEVLLKGIPAEDYSSAIHRIDLNLPDFKTPEVRLKLLQRKLDLERNYLRALRMKPILTTAEEAKLEYLPVACLATMSHMVKSEDIHHETDIFEKKNTLMEELIDYSPVDFERWYRFQIEKVNSRLPRREQGQPDDRTLLFTNEKWNPDPWQVEFLHAVEQQQSVIIVAPTASGKTYASYYAMHQVLNDKFGPKGICVYVAPTKALVNQVSGKLDSS